MIGVQASTLSPERQDVVTEHKLRSKDDALDIANDIEQREGAAPATPAPAPSPAAPAQRKKRAAQAKRKAAARKNAAGSSTQP